MGVISCCARSILLIINLVFMVLAIAMIILGAVILAVSGKFQALFEEHIGGLSQDLGGDASDVEVALNVTEIVMPVAIGMIVFGSIMLVISIIGCCGTCCDIKVLLLAYAITLFIIILIEIIFFALAFTGAFEKHMRQDLFDRLRNYKGLTDLSGDSLFWTWIMLDLQCCGLYGYKDFGYATDWKRELTYHGNTYQNMDTPYACCRMAGEYPSLDPIDENCPTDANDYNNYMYEGCWTKIESIVDSYKIWVLVACIVILVVELLLILLAFCAYFHKDSAVVPF